MLKQEIKKKIIQKSISLEEYGLDDLAWYKEDATSLINSVMKDGIGILGGDVYQLKLKCLEPLYDNWACEPYPAELEAEYYLRSKMESLKYIEKYPVQIGENIIFSITFTEKIC